MQRQMSIFYQYCDILFLVHYGSIHVLVLCSVADTVSSGNWFTLFKVLTLNIIMLTVFLHLDEPDMQDTAGEAEMNS